MDQVLAQLTSPGTVLVLVALLLVLVAVVIAWWLRRRRASGSVLARLQRSSGGVLAGVLIPNTDAGQIHLEYALLTKQGIVVVDVRDVAGNIFGSETMHDWTVLAGKQRFTFANTLPVLYDRVAAVKRLLPELPVRGCVAFTAKAAITKGFPPNVQMLDRLLDELVTARSAENPVPAVQLQAGWARLRDEEPLLRSKPFVFLALDDLLYKLPFETLLTEPFKEDLQRHPIPGDSSVHAPFWIKTHNIALSAIAIRIEEFAHLPERQKKTTNAAAGFCRPQLSIA